MFLWRHDGRNFKVEVLSVSNLSRVVTSATMTTIMNRPASSKADALTCCNHYTITYCVQCPLILLPQLFTVNRLYVGSWHRRHGFMPVCLSLTVEQLRRLSLPIQYIVTTGHLTCNGRITVRGALEHIG